PYTTLFRSHRRLLHDNSRLPRPPLLPHEVHGRRARDLTGDRSHTSGNHDLLRHSDLCTTFQAPVRRDSRNNPSREPGPLPSRNTRRTVPGHSNRIDSPAEAPGCAPRVLLLSFWDGRGSISSRTFFHPLSMIRCLAVGKHRGNGTVGGFQASPDSGIHQGQPWFTSARNQARTQLGDGRSSVPPPEAGEGSKYHQPEAGTVQAVLQEAGLRS